MSIFNAREFEVHGAEILSPKIEIALYKIITSNWRFVNVTKVVENFILFVMV
jgi:hypothetical protein